MPILGSSSSGGLKPTTPTIGTATADNESASVPFTTSSYVGKGTITYTATSNPGGFTGTSASSPITVSGLSNGTSYTFTVVGSTNYGISSEVSGTSNSVTPAIPQAGYVAGGAVSGGSGRTSIITKLSFTSETSSNLSSRLTREINYPATAANSGTAGYITGGTNSDNNYSRMEKLTFSTETNSELGSFQGIRYYHTGFANSGTAGYFSGGFDGSNAIYLSSIKKLTFSGESLSTIGANLSHNNATYSAGMANSGTAGYISGGTKGYYTLNMSKIDKLTFSNDSISTLSYTYSPNRNGQTSFANSGTAGYYAGGQFVSNDNIVGAQDIYKVSFSNDSVSNLAATLSVLNDSAGGFAKSGTAGYISGGYSRSSNSYISTIQKLTFSNDSVSTLAASTNPRSWSQGFANSGVL
jgi:hypothetical protein